MQRIPIQQLNSTKIFQEFFHIYQNNNKFLFSHTIIKYKFGNIRDNIFKKPRPWETKVPPLEKQVNSKQTISLLSLPNGNNILENYKIQSKEISKRNPCKTTIISYFLHSINILNNYKQLPDKTLKLEIRETLTQLIASDLKFLAPSLTEPNMVSDEVLNSLIIFASLCFFLNLHTRKLYEAIIQPNLKMEAVCQFKDLNQLTTLLFYIGRYEKNFPSQNSSEWVLQHIETNFASLVGKSTKFDIISILEALAEHQLSDNLKGIISKEIEKLIKKGEFCNNQLFKLVIWFSKGKMPTEKDNVKLELEKRISKMNLEFVDESIVRRSLFFLKFINQYSSQCFNKIILFLMEHKEFLNDRNLFPLLNYLSESPYPINFLKFLESHIKQTYQKEKYSIAVLTTFLFQFTKLKLLTEALFKTIEKFIIDNIETFDWKSVDIRHILCAARLRGFSDSMLFEKLEPKLQVFFKKNNLNFQDFCHLVYEISQGIYLPQLRTIQTILNKTKENIAILKNSSEEITFLRSILLLIMRYKYQSPDYFSLKLKNYFSQELNFIFSEFFKRNSLNLKDPNMRIKLFQILFTLKIEFPEVFHSCPQGEEIINKYEAQNASSNFITSSLAHDISKVLTKMKIEYSLEKRVYVYYIDIFIQPNLAIQIEGNSHYARDTLKEIPKNFFRDYHLQSLGYEIIKVPSHEFENILECDNETQIKYLHEKIFHSKQQLNSIN